MPEGTDVPNGNPNDGPDGCFPNVMAGVLLLVAIIVVACLAL